MCIDSGYFQRWLVIWYARVAIWTNGQVRQFVEAQIHSVKVRVALLMVVFLVRMGFCYGVARLIGRIDKTRPGNEQVADK